MRKDVMLAVAAVAIAVVGYLTWQSIDDDMTIKTDAPQVSAPATPPAAAPETAPPATPPAQAPQQ
jgi:hypothetical protein